MMLQVTRIGFLRMPLISGSAQSAGDSEEETGCIVNRRFVNVRPVIHEEIAWQRLRHVVQLVP
jgi:hypothetical protein